MPAQDRVANGFSWRESGQGPAVLLLHGLGGTRLSWEAQLDGLPGCRACAWELPGYGDAAPLSEALTFTGLADAVGRWADTMDVDRFHLVGISMGGMIAQYVAAADPQRVQTLTLLATSPKFGLDGTPPDQWRAARLAPLDAGAQPSDFAESVLSSLAGPSISAAALTGQVAAMQRISAGGLRAAIDCLVTHDSRAILEAIHAPTIVMVGSADAETPLAYGAAVAAGIPGAELRVIPGAGHLLNAEAPVAVNQTIEEQVRR